MPSVKIKTRGKCPRCGGKIMGNYPDDVFCVNCGYQIYFDTDLLMQSLLMLERNRKWQQSETIRGTENLNYGPRLSFSNTYGKGV